MRPAAENEQNRAEALIAQFPSDHVRRDVPMRDHTTFRIGGPADLFLTPASGEECRDMIRACESAGVPWFVLGNGSNLLVSDGGFRGAVISLSQNLSKMVCSGTVVRAQAGALLSAAASFSAKEGLTGLEFASGIPGTVGGACFMNAGAYGGEMGDVISSVTYLTREGEIRNAVRDDLSFGYRRSSIAENGWIVLAAELDLTVGDPGAIAERMKDLNSRRAVKQPLTVPSAGSTFRRPKGFFAGKLIDEAGLRGYRVGGASVSEKHCGFVVNDRGASAEDVRALIRRVQERVRETSGVVLEPEVRFLGEFEE